MCGVGSAGGDKGVFIIFVCCSKGSFFLGFIQGCKDVKQGI